MERLYQKLILPIVSGFAILILFFLIFEQHIESKVANEIRMREIGYMEESLASYFSSQKDFLSKILVLMSYAQTDPQKYRENPPLYATVDAVGRFDIQKNTIEMAFKFSNKLDKNALLKIIKKNFPYAKRLTRYYFFYFVGDTFHTELPNLYLLAVKITDGKGVLLGQSLYPTLYMNMPSTIRNRVFITTDKTLNRGPYISLNPVFPEGRKILILFKNPINIESSLNTYKKYMGGASLVFLLFVVLTLFATVEYFKYNFNKKLWPIVNLLNYLSGYRIDEFETMSRTLGEWNDAILRNMVNALGKIKELVVIDPLTGAFTREYIMKRIEEEINKCSREQCTFSILYIDFDNFKEINDRYGHLVGDKVLQAFVKLIKRITRPYDVIGRMGGDEFVLLLPSQGLSEAMRVAQRILEVLSKDLGVTAKKTVVKPKISIGVTTFRPTDKRPEQVIERADSALLKAKEAGKNRVLAIY